MFDVLTDALPSRHRPFQMERAGIEILGYFFNKDKRAGSDHTVMQNYKLAYRIQNLRGSIFHQEIQTIAMQNFDQEIQRFPPQQAYHFFEYVMMTLRPLQN